MCFEFTAQKCFSWLSIKKGDTAVIKPISFAARGVVALEKTHLSVFLHCGTQVFFCEVSVLSVQHLLLQLRGHAFGRVPLRVVGVPGERAQGAAP